LLMYSSAAVRHAALLLFARFRGFSSAASDAVGGWPSRSSRNPSLDGVLSSRSRLESASVPAWAQKPTKLPTETNTLANKRFLPLPVRLTAALPNLSTLEMDDVAIHLAISCSPHMIGSIECMHAIDAVCAIAAVRGASLVLRSLDCAFAFILESRQGFKAAAATASEPVYGGRRRRTMQGRFHPTVKSCAGMQTTCSRKSKPCFNRMYTVTLVSHGTLKLITLFRAKK
jgi:hypothetical protein